jgi:SOUL heme-binding protein.
MKMLIIILAVIILLTILLQSFIIMSTNKTEEQKYSIIQKYKDFEIRFYPSATIATINSNAKTYRELSGPGFRRLAGYIFGGNEANTKISMTTPVQMNINDSVSTMSFVMPSAYTKENMPKPNDPNVQIKNTSDEYVAVIRFGGYASDKNLKFYSEKLQNLLKENGITSFGNYRFLGYNPPYQFIGRRNEIIVSVIWVENNTRPFAGSSKNK